MKKYYNSVMEKPTPNQHFVFSLQSILNRHPIPQDLQILEVGGLPAIDSAYAVNTCKAADINYHIDIIDIYSEGAMYVEGLPLVTFICDNFLTYHTPQKYDLVSAQSVLSTLHIDDKSEAIKKLYSFAKSGGTVSFTVHGFKDTLNQTRPDAIFMTKEEIIELCALQSDNTAVQEVEFEKNSEQGENHHWHMYNVISIKR